MRGIVAAVLVASLAGCGSQPAPPRVIDPADFKQEDAQRKQFKAGDKANPPRNP